MKTYAQDLFDIQKCKNIVNGILTEQNKSFPNGKLFFCCEAVANGKNGILRIGIYKIGRAHV